MTYTITPKDVYGEGNKAVVEAALREYKVVGFRPPNAGDLFLPTNSMVVATAQRNFYFNEPRLIAVLTVLTPIEYWE